VDSTINNSI